MAQAMSKERVIELLEYYKDIDGEVKIYRKILEDLTDQYYNPLGAIQCDGLPKGKYNISRQTENMVLNIPDYVSGQRLTMQPYEILKYTGCSRTSSKGFQRHYL